MAIRLNLTTKLGIKKMKIKNILLTITMLLFATAELFANTNPVVTNVAFSISSTIVTVTYDVVDAEESTVTVYMEVSDDSGTTWDFDYGVATGAIGSNITEGTGKTITWTYSDGENTNFKIKILADDLFGDQIYYSYQIYNTVDINGQIWLKENLNVGTKINSTTSGQQQTDNSTIEKFCSNNDESNCDTYGGLYEWDEAMQYVTTAGAQGICPSGWHIPTYAQMQTLETYVGDEATKLIDENAKSGYTFSNTTGFSALFAGERNFINGSFPDLSSTAYFWSSTGYYMRLHYNISSVFLGNGNKLYGFSIRCLKD